MKGLLYKHITDSRQKFLALGIPKSWKYTVLVEVHDKLGHQGNTCTYWLTGHYVTAKRPKFKITPLQMTEIPD